MAEFGQIGRHVPLEQDPDRRAAVVSQDSDILRFPTAPSLELMRRTGRSSQFRDLHVSEEMIRQMGVWAQGMPTDIVDGATTVRRIHGKRVSILTGKDGLYRRPAPQVRATLDAGQIDMDHPLAKLWSGRYLYRKKENRFPPLRNLS